MHQVAEINVRVWRHERSQELGRLATLDDVSDAMLDRFNEQGFTWLYLHGLWPVGALARGVALRDQHLRTHLNLVMPDHTDADIIGWSLAPAESVVAEDLGGDAALARLRDRCRASGLALMLDFVPNHVGIDHPWTLEHPDWFIRGSDSDCARHPNAWIRIGGHVMAHGRDPFFAPWPETVQLDYSNPAVHQAMIAIAAAIAGRCDGLRCDMAMLLLPDVFQSTWGRTTPPFWATCLESVRRDHPGTLFMAEVYWNREYELQQSGFDFTYDKILYDRLLQGDAEAIRAHLHAGIEYQNHCVRFIENHGEQRAAIRFPNPDHHRGALFIAGMVPGMLLLHHGQERGLTLHTPLQASRHPTETGSPAHTKNYDDLIHLLGEHARQHGIWKIIEPRDGHGRALIAMYWNQTSHAGLLVIVNASWSPVVAALDGSAFAGSGSRDLQFTDCFDSTTTATFTPTDLRDHGLPLALPAWGTRALRVTPVRSNRTSTNSG